jgi:hypothetical protein
MAVAKNEIKKLLLGCGVDDTSNTLWGVTPVVAFFVAINSKNAAEGDRMNSNLQSLKITAEQRSISASGFTLNRERGI